MQVDRDAAREATGDTKITEDKGPTIEKIRILNNTTQMQKIIKAI